MSSWELTPTGMIILPDTASWVSNAPGTAPGAAVTMMASKGPASGQPRDPSPTLYRMFV